MNQWKWCVEVDGKVVKGWYFDNGKWYHLDENTGVMNTGWFQDKDQRWYYLDEQNGDLKTGWIQLKNVWFFLEPSSNGYMGECYVNRTATIDGKSYSFDVNGHLIEDSLVSDSCVNFVKEYEAFYNKAYYDGTGYTDAQLTIGYGTTKASVPEAFENGINSTITEEKACYYLKQEIDKMAKIIKSDLDSKGISLTQSQQDALYSFSYNCGESALLNSTLYRNICNGVRDKYTITSNFQAWSMAGGKRLDGLYKRRTAEANIFNNGIYDSTH